MQMSAFRGSRTVTSFRLCSRAPWTTSSSAAIPEPFYRPNGRSYLQPAVLRYTSVSIARRAFVAAAVTVAVIFGALALWKLRVVIALLFLALIIAAAVRPGVERLSTYGVPRALGVLLHYLALLVVVGVLLWQIVPHAVSQVQEAIGNVPTT